MKKYLRTFLFNIFSFNIVITFIPGFTNDGGLKTLIIATILLGIFNYFIKPILSLLLLPINLITLGGFKWFINVIVIFLITISVEKLHLSSFQFTGIEYSGFVIPSFNISKFFVLIISSAVFSLTNIFLDWLTSNKN